MEESGIKNDYLQKEDINSLEKSKAYSIFVSSRCEEILSNNEEYKQCNKLFSEICQKLEETLNPSQLAVFEECLEKHNEIESIVRAEIYKCRVKDIINIIEQSKV